MDDKPKAPLVPPEPPGTSAGSAAGLPPKRRPPLMVKEIALAMELPFIPVAAVGIGGGVGYLLDRWLHSFPWLSLLMGALGFVGGMREVLRRVSREDK